MGSRQLFARKDKTDSEHFEAIQTLQAAGNAPASLYSDAAGKFAEVYGSAKVGEGRMFIVAMLSLLLGLSAIGALAFVLPLKEVRPWVVEINPSNGVVNRPVEVQRIDPNVAVIKAELGRWAEAVYSIDPIRSSESLRWANARTADKAVGQFAEFRSRERIFERINREPDMVREVRVTAVDVSQKGTAFIFLSTSERVGTAPPAPDKTKKYRVTLNYKLMPGTQEKEVLANPLGLYVTFFADTEERAL